jgi:hypothetical protein
MSYRSIIADKIRAVLDAAGAEADGITVYEAGQDVIKTPCVVVHPADPYLVPVTMSLEANIQVFVDLYIVSNRSSVKDSMDQMEKIRHWVTTGIKTGELPIGRWTSFGRFGAIPINDVQYAGSVVQAMFMAPDTE